MKNIIISLVLCLSLLFVTTSVALANGTSGATIQQSTQQTQVIHKLHRSTTDKQLGGVCGGLGEYFGIDSSLIRVGFVLFTLAGGAGLLLYVVLWLILPEGQ